MAKAGTAWLGDQLRHHPEFWMPPIQELAYLGRDAPALRSANRKLERLRQRPRRKISPGDIGFLQDVTGTTGKQRNLETYFRFFRHKGHLLSGDISPGYCALEAQMIRGLAMKSPNLRAVLLIRDPLERLWSHLCMWRRNGKIDDKLLIDPGSLRLFLNKTRMANERSSPVKIIAHWKGAAPKLAFRYFFFDDIVTRPDVTRADILAFLGANPELRKGNFPAGHNRKATTDKPKLTPPIRSVLIEYCADDIRACGRELGGWAQEWESRYGL